jgi:hypothetical protein
LPPDWGDTARLVSGTGPGYHDFALHPFAMKNRVFFPQPLLDVLMDGGKIDVSTEEIVLTESGHRYRVVEAVRVLREVTDGADPHDLCGRVKSRMYLQELGAELLGDSMIVADKAYEVLTGFVGLPLGPPAGRARGEADTEEQVLLRLASAVR